MFLWQEQQEARQGQSGCRKLGAWTRKKGGRGGKAETLVHTFIHPHMCKNTLKTPIHVHKHRYMHRHSYVTSNHGHISHAHTCVQTHTQICTHMYSHIHTHGQTPLHIPYIFMHIYAHTHTMAHALLHTHAHAC